MTVQHPCAPEGFGLLEFPSTIQVIRLSDQKSVGEFPKPYLPFVNREELEAVIRENMGGVK